MKPTFHKHFVKTYRKMPPTLRQKVKERLRLFERDPFSPELNNHILQGKYKDHRSINITGDMRAIYVVLPDQKIQFLKLGTHSQLYG